MEQTETQFEEEVKKQIEYDCLISHPDNSVVQMAEEIKDLMVDVLCGERSVVSEGKRVSEETAKSAYRKITFDHVQYVMKSLVSYPDKISRIDRFLTASLFNSVYTLTNSTFAGFEHNMQMKMFQAEKNSQHLLACCEYITPINWNLYNTMLKYWVLHLCIVNDVLNCFFNLFYSHFFFIIPAVNT